MVFGLPLVEEKSIVIPTFHDEAPAYLPIYKKVLTDRSSYSFNTPEELKVFQNILGFKPNIYSITGMNLNFDQWSGFKENSNSNVNFNVSETLNLSNQTKSSDSNIPFLLYVGRVDQGKGFLEMVEWFLEWKKKSYFPHTLKIAGKIVSKISKKILENQNVEFLGFVEENTKLNLIDNCSCLINSSPLESFSIVLMEAWLKEKPVLVNARSDVLKGHCIRSNGGLFYSDRKSFVATLNFILDHPLESIEMGKNGKKYVEQNFNPKIVKEKLIRLIEKTIQKKYSSS